MPTGEVSAPEAGGRRALIDATVAEIEDHGLAGVSLRGITRRAEVSHAAPAHHFRDKAGLFTAVALEGFEQLGHDMTEAMEAASRQGPAKRLEALGVAYVSFAISRRAHFEVMFRPELLHTEDPELRDAATTTFGILREAVRSAQDEGFGSGWDGDELTLAAWSMVHGIVQLGTQGVLAEMGFPADPVAMAERLTRLVGDVIASVGR